MYRANNRVYLGEAVHKGTAHQGEHEAIIDRGLWDRVHAVVDPRLARGPYQTSAWAHTRPVEGLDFRADGRSNDADAHAQERSAVSLLRGERRDQNWEFTLTYPTRASGADRGRGDCSDPHFRSDARNRPCCGIWTPAERGMPRKQSNAVTSTTITVHVPMTFPVYGGHKAIISEIVCAPGERPGRLPERSKAPATAVQSPPQRTENALLKALARAHRCALSRSALGQFPDPAATSQEPADGPITAIKLLGWPGVLPKPSCLHG